MTILTVHNRYQQAGGEDHVYHSEVRLLRRHGHEVVVFEETNDRISGMGKFSLAVATLWNRQAYQWIARLVRKHRPAIVHFHNTFPLLSPACYYAARLSGAAVVQTLHNYRLVCPNATLYRNGSICEECITATFPYPAVIHRCYRRSIACSVATASMLTLHRALKTWTNAVDKYIVLTDFARSVFMKAGFPKSTLALKPNFVFPDPGPRTGCQRFALFVGRLSEEKGMQTLVDAWRQLPSRVPLTVVGEGPLAPWLAQLVTETSLIRYIGQQPREEVRKLMRQASCLVFPSKCYEGFPLVIAEALANGLPVLASNIGSAAELISDEGNGLLFSPGDAADLSRKVETLFSDEKRRSQYARAARRTYEDNYTADRNYRILLEIYASARDARAAKREPLATVGGGHGPQSTHGV